MQKSRTLSLISIYCLAAFSSMLLAYAEIAFLPQCLTPVIVIVAFVLVERKKVFSLSTLWANILGLASVLLAAQEFFFGSLEGRLLSGAHLLVYLMWIVLLQKKQTQHYWWLITLSLLQVSVGSVLTNDGSYGLFLVLFLMASIWTLSLFWIQQVQDQFTPQEKQPLNNQVSVVTQQNIAVPQQSNVQGEVLPSALLVQQKSFARTGICFIPGETWLTSRFFTGVMTNIAGAILISVFFFVLIPRLWLGSGRIAEARDSALATISTLTGFTEEVKLGAIGSILESNEKVLEVRMFHQHNSEPIDVEQQAAKWGYEEPYFRGTVLELYQDGNWKLVPKLRSQWYSEKEIGFTPAENRVRQEYELQPIGTEKLFAIHPFLGGQAVNSEEANNKMDIYRNEIRHYLMVNESVEDRKKIARKKMNYTIISPSNVSEQDQKYLPITNKSYLNRNLRNLYTTLPSEDIPQLIALAKDVAHQGQATTDQLIIAKRLVHFLRDTGKYTYTLKMTQQDRSIDPVEDFLINRKSGHCEYYATALTLMLRAVDIPARLVNGFKGGEKNTFTGAYEVQQRHAHAWVEAHIDGYWILLDATPATRAESVNSLGSSFGSWEDFKSMMKAFWTENIVQMSYSKQKQTFYTPLKKSLFEWWNSISQVETGGQSTMAAIKNLITSPEKWISVGGGIVSFLLMLILLGTYFMGCRILPWVLRQIANIRQHQREKKAAIKVDFYERFCKLCASKGLTRSQTETQQEFATSAIDHFNAELKAIDSPVFPQELVTSFYRIRFGGQQIEEPKRHVIDQLLTKLEQQFAAS